MRNNTRPSYAGKHRKVSSRTKGRVALAAAVATTVSSAGIGGAAAATLTNEDQPTTADVELVNDSQSLQAQAVAAAPQILNINEYKPTANAGDQLNKAVDYSNQRAEEAAAAAQAEADRLAAEATQAAQAAGLATSSTAEVSSNITGASVVKPAQGSYTSGFGPRWGTNHNGIDIANAIGTPILAAMAGTVIDSGPASGFGQWIRIQHSDGTITVYGHMSTLNVSVGQQVQAGQLIAGMGSEGQSTGSHLHFEVHPAGSGPIDPEGWLNAHGITL